MRSAGLRALGLITVFAVAACSDGGGEGDPKDVRDAGGTAADGGGSIPNGRAGSGAPRPMTDGGQSPDSAIPGATALRIEPASVALTEDGVEPFEMADFRAIATFENGDERD